MQFNTMPTKCNISGGSVEYLNMKDVGIRPFQSGKCYYCTACGAYVGTHQKRPKEALGILADSEGRKLRALCHSEFDLHWVSLSGKNKLYFRLSKALGIQSEMCHFGYMDNGMLRKAYKVMKSWGDMKLR